MLEKNNRIQIIYPKLLKNIDFHKTFFQEVIKYMTENINQERKVPTIILEAKSIIGRNI